MDTNTHDAEPIGKIFDEYLAAHGLRKTAERKAILKQICRIHGHFNIDMLYEQLEAINFRVSKASIYNTIDLLMNACLIVRHQFSTQFVQYELKNAAMHHHHSVCCYCGAVREIKIETMTRLFKETKIPKFTQEYFSMYIYGMCSKCKFRITQQKQRQNNK